MAATEYLVFKLFDRILIDLCLNDFQFALFWPGLPEAGGLFQKNTDRPPTVVPPVNGHLVSAAGPGDDRRPLGPRLDPPV